MNPFDHVHTPARKDKHLWSTLLFTAIVCANHKFGLLLSMGELMVLGSVLGFYMGQSQLGQWAKFQTAIGADNNADQPK